MLVKGSKIVLKKMLPGMENTPLRVGMTMKVSEINGNMILLDIPDVGNGGITFAEYEEYFEERKEEKRKWSEWIYLDTVAESLFGTYGQFNVYYKTNGKTVAVKITSYNTDEVYAKGRANCHPADTFDKRKGQVLAYARAYKKYIDKRAQEELE